MSNKKLISTFTLILWLFLFLAIIFALTQCYYAQIPEPRPNTTYFHPRTGKVIHNVKVMANSMLLSDQRFMQYVKWFFGNTGYDEIIYIKWRNLERQYCLKEARIYYYAKDS